MSRLDATADKVLAALGHAPEASDRCTAHVVIQSPIGRPPGVQNPPIWCCLKAGHEGKHHCNHGSMSHPFAFHDSDVIEFSEVLTLCAKCRTVWPCPDAVKARAAIAKAEGQ